MIMLYLIACISKNWGLGYKGQLLFHYPEDMAFFKEKTMGNIVVMGRKTYESLGRPLEGRVNVVFTRDKDYSAPGCITLHSIEDYYNFAQYQPPHKDIYVIGGAEIYKMFIEQADAMYLTEVNQIRPADAFFPQFDREAYTAHTKSVGKGYKIIKYTKPTTRF